MKLLQRASNLVINRVGQRKAFFHIALSALLIAGMTQMAHGQNGDYEINTVVIDAGHGGHDSGCHGSNSKEKHITLIIALKLGKYIEGNIEDVKVIYTRKTDVFVELHERASIANRNNADLFISIHCNAINHSGTHGTETFVMGLHKSEDNLDVAKRENKVILLESNYDEHYDGFAPNAPESHIIFSLYQNANLDQSINFASKVEEQFKNRARRRSRGVKRAGFVVLFKTTMPAVLIETGFLTNSSEERFLLSDQGQSYIASAIYRAFKKYKAEYEGRITESEGKPAIAEESEEPEEEPATEQTTNPEPATTGNPTSGLAEENPADEVIFKIQIRAAYEAIPPDDPVFDGIENLSSQEVGNGLFRYFAGRHSNYNAAINHMRQLRQNGYADAFLVAFKNGERIAVKEALAEK